VNAKARCVAAGHTYEYSITVFSQDHYYSGYYCQYAAEPLGTDLPPLGEMTGEGTAMDTEFFPYAENPTSD